MFNYLERIALTVATFPFPEHVIFMIKTGATTVLCVSFMNYLYLHNCQNGGHGVETSNVSLSVLD